MLRVAGQTASVVSSLCVRRMPLLCTFLCDAVMSLVCDTDEVIFYVLLILPPRLVSRSVRLVVRIIPCPHLPSLPSTSPPHQPPTTCRFEISENTPFEINPLIIALSIVGWVVPSSLPAPIALTSGTGLTQAFLSSMNANLAAWPKGPAGDDPFWTLCFLWHVGLFAALIFGTIGVNGRKSGGFDV